MDVQTIDQSYQQLQGQSQQTVQALQTLGNKLQTAAAGGDQQAREWLLDLRELALSFRSEQDQVTNLLQALHGFVANQAQMQQASPPPPQGNWGQSPGYAPQPGYPQQQPGYAQAGGFMGGAAPAGGMIGNFLNSGFGRAIEMGAGFGIGDDLINKIF
ncbi:hypothetical protein [Lichenicoccus sp.]|uniref:hypothetical protein n=1 Tax=Lichenicoccus sp. TaxID=2781899 RepID=UPI003D0D4232